MSAFLCTPTHMAAVVSWASKNGSIACSWAGFGAATPQGIATMLHQENIKSLRTRYPDTFQEFGPPHEFTACEIASAPKLSTVGCLKAIACIEYQSCEHEGWSSSRAARFLQAVKGAAIAALPGWASEAWCIADPAPAGLGR